MTIFPKSFEKILYTRPLFAKKYLDAQHQDLSQLIVDSKFIRDNFKVVNWKKGCRCPSFSKQKCKNIFKA